MKASKIIIICPFSRPEFAKSVYDNFLRQDYQNKELIIIENGKAIGAWKYPTGTVLQSANHQAAAKNKGLEYIGDKFKGQFWTTWDDDDYYGANQLSELAENSDKADVVGKLNIFMRASNGKLRFIDMGAENDFVESLWGCSISSWIQDVEFPDTGVWGEDLSWIDIMKGNGAKLWATSRYNICINRFHGNNTWKTTDQNIVNTSKEVFEYDFDLDIVNNIKQVDGKLIDRNTEFDFSHMEEMIDHSFFDKFIEESLKGDICLVKS
jgi:glycosyltransferase involved in cell wall biosynthesis